MLTLGNSGGALTGLSLPLAPEAMQLVVRMQARVRGVIFPFSVYIVLTHSII